MAKTSSGLLDSPPPLPLLDDDPWIKAPDVAALTGVSVSAVRSWVARRQGPPHYRIMGHVRFRRSDVNGWIEARRVDGDER